MPKNRFRRNIPFDCLRFDDSMVHRFGRILETHIRQFVRYGHDRRQHIRSRQSARNTIFNDRRNALLGVCRFKRLFEKHFRVELFEQEECTLRFDTPVELLRHLKNTGVTGISGHSRQKGFDFIKRYRKTFDGKKRSRSPIDPSTSSHIKNTDMKGTFLSPV